METIEYFDYITVAKSMKVPNNIIKEIEIDVRQEFPNDKMLYELHVLRAIKSKYWLKNKRNQ